jgi:uncharacterized delta-60 repeat protein
MGKLAEVEAAILTFPKNAQREQLSYDCYRGGSPSCALVKRQLGGGGMSWMPPLAPPAGSLPTSPSPVAFDIAHAVVPQPDGKIVAAGRADFAIGNHTFALARYNADGTLDATFGTAGRVFSEGPWRAGPIALAASPRLASLI